MKRSNDKLIEINQNKIGENIMGSWFECMGRQIFGPGLVALAVLLGFLVVFLVAMMLACIGAHAGWIACMKLALIAAGVFFIVAVAIWFVIAAVECLTTIGGNAAVGVVGPGQNSSALTGVSTCEEAEAELAATNSTVASALSNRNQKATAVTARQQQVNAAKVAVIGAGIAVAASFLFPLSLIAALATLAAATAYLGNRNAALATAKSALALAEAQLVQAISEQAAAETLVEQLCDKGPSTGIISTGDVPGFTTG